MAGSAEEFKLAPGAKRLAPAPRLPRRVSVHRLLHGLAQLGGAGLMTLGTGCSLLAPAPPARKPSTGLPPSAPGTVPAQPAAGATAAPQPFGPPPNALSADAAARDLVAQAMLLVGTLVNTKICWPAALACSSAASVSAVSPLWLTAMNNPPGK
jgi:hypothetical protein